MGRLKVLEVENFKSYSGRHIVGPFSDFACIIGPNGSGKSNMMDAISFVLGIQSKHLRSNHLKELLYRKDVDSLPARKASVKLVYQFDDDEVDGRRAGEEISLERTVSSSGVGAYRLGDKEVTFEVYDSFLQSIGVLTKVRNFLVFQGDVETVASKSPVELTKMFEQISGSDLLSSEYDELLKRKEEAEEAMQLAMQTKKMMSGQCRAAKGQKDEADEFLAKKDDLSQLKTELVMWQLWRIKSEMDENQKSIESLQDDAKVIELREAEILVETQSEKKEVAKFNKQLSAAEKDYASKRKLIDTVTPKLLEIRSNIKSTVKRIKDLEKSESNVRKDLENQQTTVEKLREEIALIQAEESTLKEKMKSANPFNVRLSDAQKAEYSRLREVVASRSAAARAEQLTAESQLKGLEQSLKQIENREDTLRQDLQMSEKAVEEYTERLQSLQKSIDLSKRDIAELLAAKDSSIRSAEKAESTLSDLGQELDGVEQKLRDAGDDRRRGKQEERMNEAIDTMQRIYKGVHGKLIDLCRPIQKKYSQAITVAAGKHMDAIVVDTKQVATDCMRYLKDQRVGTCLFLPLDNISVKPIPERYRTFGSKYRPCIDLIDCEENIKAAVSYAVGSTLVCDTLEEAQELCFQKNESVKVVTLRGHVINKSGAMTGGSVRENFQDRWEEKEVENLRKTKEDLLSKISEVNRSLPSRQQILDFDTKVRTKQSRLQFSESELRVIEQKLSQLEQQRAMKVEHAKKLEQEKVKMISAVRKQESKISELQEGIASVESVVFSEFSVSVGVENIREYEENSLKKHEQLLQKTNAATKQLASLTSQLEYEMKRDFSGSLKRVEEQVRNSRMNLEKLEEDEQAILQKELHVRQLAKEAQQQVDRLKQEKDKFDQTWRLLQAQRDEITNDRKLIMSKISKEELSIEGARAKLHEVLQKAEMDEVSLPTVEITSVEANQASSRSSAQDSDSSDDRESDLIWTGNRSASFSSQRQRAAGRSNKETEETEESFSSGSASRGTESTHFSKSSNPIVRKYVALLYIYAPHTLSLYHLIHPFLILIIFTNSSGIVAKWLKLIYLRCINTKVRPKHFESSISF